MSGKRGPETILLGKMRDAGKDRYGERLVIIKYHGGTYSANGVSDLLCCIDGVFVAVEVKTPKGVVTVKQQAFGDHVLKAGGVFAVCRTVEEFLETLGAAVARGMYRDLGGTDEIEPWIHTDDGSVCEHTVYEHTVYEHSHGHFCSDRQRSVE